MFFRTKRHGDRAYLQIVQNRRENGKIKQRVVATLGRLDQLQEEGQLDRLLHSGARFAEAVMVLQAHGQGELPVIASQRVGPVQIFERLWRESGCQAVIEQLLAERRYEFPVERAIFLTVLHRIMVSGSDRAAE